MKLCWHKYEDLGFDNICYGYSCWEFKLQICEKCGKIRTKKKLLWRVW